MIFTVQWYHKVSRLSKCFVVLLVGLAASWKTTDDIDLLLSRSDKDVYRAYPHVLKVFCAQTTDGFSTVSSYPFVRKIEELFTIYCKPTT